MTVVSAGVETLEQHAELAQLGCDACEGCYFARPMPATSLDSLIERSADQSNLAVLRAHETRADNPGAPSGLEVG